MNQGIQQQLHTPAICVPYCNEPPPEYIKRRWVRKVKRGMARAVRTWLGSGGAFYICEP